MKMKLFMASAILAMCATNAMAQATCTDKEGNEYQFEKHAFLDLQGGAQYTLGEAKFGDLISPNVQLGLGYQFSPVFGMRLQANGWQSKGGWAGFRNQIPRRQDEAQGEHGKDGGKKCRRLFVSCLTLKGDDGQLGYCRPKQKKLDAFTKKIREILKRNQGVSIQRIVAELNAYLRGWINYYARSNTTSWLRDKAGWIRRTKSCTAR